MFSQQFRERLSKGKYTRWAVDMTEEHLAGLLWAVGEYGCRSPEMLDMIWKNRPTGFDPSYARATLALEVIADFKGRRPMDVECYRRRVQILLADLYAAYDSLLSEEKTDPETNDPASDGEA